MVAKEAIRTSKQPGTKAETTSRQAVTIREDHKVHSVMTKREKGIGRRWRPVSMQLLK